MLGGYEFTENHDIGFQDKLINKLGQLEDIEEKLNGCSLIGALTAIKMWRKGVGYVDVLRVVLNEEATYPYVDLCYKNSRGKYKVETLFFHYTYGIKFALTREELEKDDERKEENRQ